MTIQIAGTASNHYEVIHQDGKRVQMVEIIIMGLDVQYEVTATGLNRRDVTSTHRFSLTLHQLAGVIDQLEDMLTAARGLQDSGNDQAS